MVDLDSVFAQLIKGTPQAKRRAVEELIDAGDQQEEILRRLTALIKEQADILHAADQVPKGAAAEDQYRQVVAASTIQQGAIQAALGILGPDGLLDSEFAALVDASGMLQRLGQWPYHIADMRQRAAAIAEQFKQRHPNRAIDKIKVYGLGGSGAPHDLAADIIGNWRKTSVEIEVVHADEPNPDHVDARTLVVCCSFSGNTEETINSYAVVQAKTDLLVFLAQGGQLAEIAARDNIPWIRLPEEADHRSYVMQPRESVCLQLTSLFTLLSHLDLPAGSQGALTPALASDPALIECVEAQREKLAPDVPFADNRAKQLAFLLLYGKEQPQLTKEELWQKKVPFVLVDRNLRALGHEVRTQLHERSKINGGYYDAPEFLHNLVESIRAGAESAAAGLDGDPYVYYFIRSVDEEPRIKRRLDETIALVLKDRCAYTQVWAEGDNPHQRALLMTYFNAYMTTYLAILNGFDPLPVPTMSWLKTVMEEIPR